MTLICLETKVFAYFRLNGYKIYNRSAGTKPGASLYARPIHFAHTLIDGGRRWKNTGGVPGEPCVFSSQRDFHKILTRPRKLNRGPQGEERRRIHIRPFYATL
jgi:hypothetical protein